MLTTPRDRPVQQELVAEVLADINLGLSLL